MGYTQPDLFENFTLYDDLIPYMEAQARKNNTSNISDITVNCDTNINYGGPTGSAGYYSYTPTGAVGGSGAGGPYISGLNGPNGPNILNSLGPNVVWNSTSYDYDFLKNTTVDIKGDANIEGDLKVKGKSLSEFIENVEQRLAILHPNSELEQKWDQLKELGNRYRQLEKEILEKEKIWATLKKGDVKINE